MKKSLFIVLVLGLGLVGCGGCGSIFGKKAPVAATQPVVTDQPVVPETTKAPVVTDQPVVPETTKAPVVPTETAKTPSFWLRLKDGKVFGVIPADATWIDPTVAGGVTFSWNGKTWTVSEAALKAATEAKPVKVATEVKATK